MIASLMVVDYWYLIYFMIKLSYMSICLNKMSFYMCNFTNRNFTNVCKMKHERLFIIISCPCNKVSHFFFKLLILSSMANNQKKIKLLHSAFYLLFHELSNFELYPLLYNLYIYIYIYSGKGNKMIESPVNRTRRERHKDQSSIKWMTSYCVIRTFNEF
jgi:hypothetical protein